MLYFLSDRFPLRAYDLSNCGCLAMLAMSPPSHKGMGLRSNENWLVTPISFLPILHQYILQVDHYGRFVKSGCSLLFCFGLILRERKGEEGRERGEREEERTGKGRGG